MTTRQLGSPFPKYINHIYIYIYTTKYGFKYLKNKTHVWNHQPVLYFVEATLRCPWLGIPQLKVAWENDLASGNDCYIAIENGDL